VTDFDAAATLAAIESATEHLLETITDFSDEDIRAETPLPGWTRGHVLTHVARNADALLNLLTTASTGVVTPMYPSQESREADIVAGATRPAAEIVADVRDSAARFATAFADVDGDEWDTPTYRTPGGEPSPAYLIGPRRLNEVLVHHVDLDADYTPAHWPDDFTAYQLGEAVTRFSARPDFPALRLHFEEDDSWHGIHTAADDASTDAVHGPQRALLAWLMGRSTGDGLFVELADGGRGPLPEIPSWG
jgi:maleylpyruvate isomerase